MRTGPAGWAGPAQNCMISNGCVKQPLLPVGSRDQHGVTRPLGAAGAATGWVGPVGGDVAGAVGRTADGVDAVALGAAEGVLLELGVAVAVEDVLALALMVGAVGLLHELRRRGFERLGEIVAARSGRVLVGEDGELGARGHVQLIAV